MIELRSIAVTTFCSPVARDYHGGCSYTRKDIGQASLIEVQLNDKKVLPYWKKKRSHVACPTIELNSCNDYTTAEQRGTGNGSQG